MQFEHMIHEWIIHRRDHKPPQTDDFRVGFNGRLGALITRGVGTMWAVYVATGIMGVWIALALWGPLRHLDPYPFPFLLFLGNIVQLLLMFVIMVGQQVLGAASDKRAIQTFKDAEAILDRCLHLQQHLEDQDKLLEHVMELAREAAGKR